MPAPGYAKLYSTKRWADLQAATLRRDGWVCQMCGVMLRKGRSDKAATVLRPAVVDHLMPHRGDASLFHDRGNLWAICCDCHDGPCQAIERRPITGEAMRAAKVAYRAVGLDGYPSKPQGRWVDAMADAWGI